MKRKEKLKEAQRWLIEQIKENNLRYSIYALYFRERTNRKLENKVGIDIVKRDKDLFKQELKINNEKRKEEKKRYFQELNEQVIERVHTFEPL